MASRRTPAPARTGAVLVTLIAALILSLPGTASAAGPLLPGGQSRSLTGDLNKTVQNLNTTVEQVKSGVQGTLQKTLSGVGQTVTPKAPAASKPSAPAAPAASTGSTAAPTATSGGSGSAPTATRQPSSGGSTGSRSAAPRRSASRASARSRRRAARRRARLHTAVAAPKRARARVVRSRNSAQRDGSPVARTVRDIVEVVPLWARYVIAALGLLSLVLAGAYLTTGLRARRLNRQRGELLQEVGLLQTALLPPVPEQLGDLHASVAYRPADGPGAGGDFYDAFALGDGRVGLILGDVSGHGRQALARTAFMRYSLRAYLEAGLEPRLALQVAGRAVGDNLGGDFATVVVAVHDPEAGSLTYACAGHPAPIIVGLEGWAPILVGGSPPIGIDEHTGLRQSTVPFPAGAVACFYTDGLAEARTEQVLLGRGRLSDLVADGGRELDAPALLDRVADEAQRVEDDMAAILVTPKAGVTSGGFRSEQMEVDAKDIKRGLAERFLKAAGLADGDIESTLEDARRSAERFGATVLVITYGVSGPRARLQPSNVEGLLEASSRLSVAAPAR